MLNTLRAWGTGLLFATGVLTVACRDEQDPAPQTQAPAPAGVLAGQVGPAGSVETVTATAAGGQQYRAAPNAAGAFVFILLPVGTYTVAYVPNAGYRAPATQTAAVTENTTTRLPAVTLDTDYSIVGQVQPAIAVAQITATSGSGRTYTSVPDATGGFTFGSLPAGTYVVAYIPRTGYRAPASQTAAVTENTATRLPNVIMEADYSIAGQVIPADAVIRVTASAGNGQVYTAIPNATGVYAFVALPAGAYTLTYTTASDYVTPANQSATVVAGTTTTLPTLTVQPTRSKLLTDKYWHVTRQILTDNTTGAVTDVFSLTPACTRDDEYLFTKNGPALISSGLTKCSPTEPSFISGTWALTANDTQLLTSYGGAAPVLRDVVQLTNTTLELRRTDGNRTEVTTYASF